MIPLHVGTLLPQGLAKILSDRAMSLF